MEIYVQNPLPKWPTYIGECCCRERVLASGIPVGRCGVCGEKPTYLRPDDWSVSGPNP